jgi:chromosomal replication initiation ATPase DnaA
MKLCQQWLRELDCVARFAGLEPFAFMRDIAKDVANEHGVTLSEMRGNRRTARLVEARKDFGQRCLDIGKGATEIGRFLRRDHSTICYYDRGRKR